MKKLSETFGEEKFNVMETALQMAAERDGDKGIYEYLDKCPKTTLVVDLVDCIEELGFRIKRY